MPNIVNRMVTAELEHEFADEREQETVSEQDNQPRAGAGAISFASAQPRART